MSNVLLTSDSSDLQARVRAAADGTCVALPADGASADPSALLARAGERSLPDVVVLDATENPELALGLAARFDQELPGTGVVLIGDPAALAIAALRVGARDVLPHDVDEARLRATLQRVHSLVARRREQSGNVALLPAQSARPGRVMTVLSPKGGAGKTTVATNIAVGLALSAPGSTVLVDLDVQFGDVATALSLEPEFTLEDVVHGAALHDPIALKTHLTLHDSGLSVVCAPENPVAAESVTADQVNALVAMLATQFRFVVVDTGAGLEARTLAALDHTTDPLLLTTYDVAGARGLRKEIDTLRELGMLNGARKIIVNFANPRSGLALNDIEATIRSRVDAALPISGAVTASLNTGVPLMLQRPKDPVARQLKEITNQFAASAMQSREA